MTKQKGKTSKKEAVPEKETTEQPVPSSPSVEDTRKMAIVYNPHTQEQVEMKIWEMGRDFENRQVAQGFFPLSNPNFSVLLEMKKLPTEPRWTVTCSPTRPIR